MSRLSRAHVFIGRIFERSASVSDRCGNNTLDFTKRLFHSPETAGCKRALFHLSSPSQSFDSTPSLEVASIRGSQRVIRHFGSQKQGRYMLTPCSCRPLPLL